MPADNTRHLRAAAQHRAEQTRRRAVAALRRMDATSAPVTLDGLAREAGVSRSWLYTQHDLRAEVERLRRRRQHPTPPVVPPERQRASDASLLRRLEAATERIRHLEHDNQQLRDALARALGERRAADIRGGPPGRDTPNRKPAKLIGPC
ncbi:MAG TPA: DUF6262 family protein [Sporichthyaceae bacterium]|jgi:hypothetical protein